MNISCGQSPLRTDLQLWVVLHNNTVILTHYSQVVILLLVADWMVHSIWKYGFDPDNVAIPFLTALGDLLGTGLLSLGFYIMWNFGDKDTDVGD